jgi:hypothetical protein
MQYQVFVKNPAVGGTSPLENLQFMASVVGLPAITANGATEQEEIDKIQSILDDQFKDGKLVTIDVNVHNDRAEKKSDPWLDNMGIFKDDPTFDDFLAEVSAYRHEIDVIENRP